MSNNNNTFRVGKGHMLTNPVGSGGVTSGTATCSCGAAWRVFYTANGMEWLPLNERQCAKHDEETQSDQEE